MKLTITVETKKKKDLIEELKWFLKAIEDGSLEKNETMGSESYCLKSDCKLE